MYNIITFGSATCDIFLRLKDGARDIQPGEDFHAGRDICFSQGEKIFAEDLQMFSGGGGTNIACALGNFGLKVAYVGKVGQDLMGEQVLADLKKFGVETKLAQKDKQRSTAISVVLSPKTGDRTILVYQGACHFLEKAEVAWDKIKKAQWFYLAPFYQKTAELFEPLLDFAKANGIKVAVNLSSVQLALGWEVLRESLQKVDILFLNDKEAEKLTGISQEDEKTLLESLAGICSGIIVVTKGEKGSVVFDDKTIFSAGIADSVVMEKTGAGDAYAAGFLAGLYLKNNIEYAILLGTVNSAGCISQMGAKNGLLTKKDLANLPKIEIKKQIL